LASRQGHIENLSWLTQYVAFIVRKQYSLEVPVCSFGIMIELWAEKSGIVVQLQTGTKDISLLQSTQIGSEVAPIQ
jgi:hypothetical protein